MPNISSGCSDSPSNLNLSVPRDGASTYCLGSLLQCLPVTEGLGGGEKSTVTPLGPARKSKFIEKRHGLYIKKIVKRKVEKNHWSKRATPL